MKKNIGTQLALYPMPLTVIGAMDGDKPTWTLVAHVGIMGHDHLMVSLAASHFVNTKIKETGKLSINMVSEDLLADADHVDSITGGAADKSDVFAYEIGDSGTPMITASPLSIECEVEDIYATKGFENFIVRFTNTYVNDTDLTPEGKINYRTMKPVLFEFPTYEYLKTGEVIGKCLTFKNKR